ncbi:hypothetical protein GCM10027058_21010 [Microbacterium neimengense]
MSPVLELQDEKIEAPTSASSNWSWFSCNDDPDPSEASLFAC